MVTSTNTRPCMIIDIPERIAPDLLEHIQQKYTAYFRQMHTDYILNMEKVDHVYSATLSLIMNLHKAALLMHSRLVIINVSERVKSALLFLKIDSTIPIFESFFDYEFTGK
jgi:anti-anti-sigma regulatory factor